MQAVALQLFWEKGYRATSTRDIAAALGVKQGSLYYYVKNKEDVLYAICFSSLQYVMDNVVQETSTASDPVDGMRRILGMHLRSALKQQRQFFISLAEYRSLSAERVTEIKIFWRDHQAFVSSVLDEGKARGLIRRDIGNRYLYFINISTVHWAVLWFRSTEPLTPEQLALIYTNVLVDGAASTGWRQSSRLKNLRKQTPHIPLAAIDVASNSTHARLLNIASSLFAQRGFSNTSVRDIAEAVGIEKASLYHYFVSKDDLNFQITLNAHEHLRGALQQAIAAACTPEEALYNVILAHITSLLQHQDWHATANEQLNALPEPQRSAIVVLRDTYQAEVLQVVAKAQDAGVLRADLPSRLLGMILLGMLTHVYPWYEADKDITPSDLGRNIADLFLMGLRA